MASINNPKLLVGADQLHNRATVTVSCDVEFTDFEVNAVNTLRLHYTLQCQLLNKDLWQTKRVAVFDEWTFPRVTEVTVSKHELVVFNTDRPMSDLHTHFLSKDSLEAELVLRNQETGQDVVSRTDVVSIDLTA